MYNEANLITEVRTALIDRIENGQAVAASWIAQEVMNNHEPPEGPDADFHLCNTMANVRRVVGSVVRSHKGEDQDAPEQNVLEGMTMPGYERLQKAYTVKRDGDWAIVPITLLSREEWEQKLQQMSALARNVRVHYDELHRWGVQHFGAEEQAS